MHLCIGGPSSGPPAWDAAGIFWVWRQMWALLVEHVPWLHSTFHQLEELDVLFTHLSWYMRRKPLGVPTQGGESGAALTGKPGLECPPAWTSLCPQCFKYLGDGNRCWLHHSFCFSVCLKYSRTKLIFIDLRTCGTNALCCETANSILEPGRQAGWAEFCFWSFWSFWVFGALRLMAVLPHPLPIKISLTFLLCLSPVGCGWAAAPQGEEMKSEL